LCPQGVCNSTVCLHQTAWRREGSPHPQVDRSSPALVSLENDTNVVSLNDNQSFLWPCESSALAIVCNRRVPTLSRVAANPLRRNCIMNDTGVSIPLRTGGRLFSSDGYTKFNIYIYGKQQPQEEPSDRDKSDWWTYF